MKQLIVNTSCGYIYKKIYFFFKKASKINSGFEIEVMRPEAGFEPATEDPQSHMLPGYTTRAIF